MVVIIVTQVIFICFLIIIILLIIIKNHTTGSNWGDKPGAFTSWATFEYSNIDIYRYTVDTLDTTALVYNANPIVTNPYIVTESNTITNWSFENFQINLGSISLYDNINNLKNFTLLIDYHSSYNDFDYSIDCTYYLDTTNKIITIPKNDLLTNYVVENFLLSFTLVSRGYNSILTYDLGSYSIIISQQQADVINGQNSMDNVNNSINNVNNSINDTNNFLKDETVDDSQFELPSVEVADPTANFFDTMFTGLYNAVTSDTDKTINLQLFGNNINVSSSDFNFLTDNRWSLLRSILSSAWVFGIGSYILKDIRKMIDKIKDGDVENMSNEDIKADMV